MNIPITPFMWIMALLPIIVLLILVVLAIPQLRKKLFNGGKKHANA